jgi:hypothetical protein
MENLKKNYLLAFNSDLMEKGNNVCHSVYYLELGVSPAENICSFLSVLTIKKSISRNL